MASGKPAAPYYRVRVAFGKPSEPCRTQRQGSEGLGVYGMDGT